MSVASERCLDILACVCVNMVKIKSVESQIKAPCSVLTEGSIQNLESLDCRDVKLLMRVL